VNHFHVTIGTGLLDMATKRHDGHRFGRHRPADPASAGRYTLDPKLVTISARTRIRADGRRGAPVITGADSGTRDNGTTREEPPQDSHLARQENRSRSVVDEIRGAIINGDFAPNQRLVEADLSDQFSASRASVRTALVELTNEGLVERVQNRGARVRAIPLSEAIEISEVRMVVEGLCAAKAAERITPQEVHELRCLGRNMRKAVANGDVLGYSVLNQQLHHRIRSISGQHTASNVLERLRAQSVRHQFRLAMRPGRPSASVSEHLAMIDAICAHQPEAAERAARAHLRSVIAALQESDEPGEGARS
jgi:DNA-binding GntR family transcriptional regulator